MKRRGGAPGEKYSIWATASGATAVLRGHLAWTTIKKSTRGSYPQGHAAHLADHHPLTP